MVTMSGPLTLPLTFCAIPMSTKLRITLLAAIFFIPKFIAALKLFVIPVIGSTISFSSLPFAL